MIYHKNKTLSLLFTFALLLVAPSQASDSWVDGLDKFFERKVSRPFKDSINDLDTWFDRNVVRPTYSNHLDNILQTCEDSLEDWVKSLERNIVRYIGDFIEDHS